MRRVLVSFALAPLLVSLLFGWPGMFFVLVFALPIALALGATLFPIFRKHDWLKWWQVGSVGLLSGVTFGFLIL